MVRRVMFLILLPCLLLPQVAAFGHSHGDNQPPGHDLRPHFHFGMSHPPQTPDHHHGPGGHNHHHHGPGGHHRHHNDGPDKQEPDPASPPQPEPASNHDHATVYVAVDVFVSGRVRAEEDRGPGPFWFFPTLKVAADHRDGHRELSAWWWHPPPLRGAFACPLYLQHLAILI